MLKNYSISRLNCEQNSNNKLRIFDFDDTLVKSDSKIKVVSKIRGEFLLTPKEYVFYEKKHDDEFDYSEFLQLINPQEITIVCDIFRKVYEKHGNSGVVILSARCSSEPIKKFLKQINIHDVNVYITPTPVPSAKATYVNQWIMERDLEYVEFFDDSHKNIEAINDLRDIHPHVDIVTYHI